MKTNIFKLYIAVLLLTVLSMLNTFSAHHIDHKLFGHLTKADQDLFEAVKTENMEQIQNALDAGANINVKNKVGYTPFHSLISHLGSGINPEALQKKLQLAEFFLKKGADINSQQRYGNTALHNVGSGISTTVVEFLLKHGANPNIQNNQGYTPLHTLAKVPSFGNSIENAKLLLDFGASTDIKNLANKTPIDLALAAPTEVNENNWFFLIKNPEFIKVLQTEGKPKRVAIARELETQTELPQDVTDLVLRFLGSQEQELKELHQKQ